ncbi:MAG: hypothetical protein GX815_10695 [Clostridiales bacterium]|nr:hypothetical protein [Clostridiales bacterium]
MQRKTKLILTTVLIITIAAVYFLMSTLQNQPEVYPVLSAEPIKISEQEELHFFSDGWIVCGSPSRFYYWDETSMEPPFSQDDLSSESNQIHITAHTDNYIVTANNRIYNTGTVPFTLVYENDDFSIWDLKEYSDFLLLLPLNKDDMAQPYILDKNSDFLISMEGIGDMKYIAADSYNKDISLLTMSINSPVPMSRIFHYKNRDELYGVLSLDNQLIYNIYRLKDSVVLIGIKDLLCYNMEGDLIWSLALDSEGQFEVVTGNDTLFFYFPEKSQVGEKQGNAIIINEREYDVKVFPKYLSNIKAFKKGYLALESDHSVVFLNQQGKVTRKQRLQDPVHWITFDSQSPETLYVRTKENILQLYTSEKQEAISK